MNYNSRILKSSNKNKTTWDIKKLELEKIFLMEILQYWISKGSLLATNKQLYMPSVIIFFL
jgi:hypothetical protein